MEIQKPKLSYSPWTEDEVNSLNGWQMSDFAHPYTCRCSQPLIATKDGWRCLHCEDYRQNWALLWLTNWEWKKTFEGMDKTLAKIQELCDKHKNDPEQPEPPTTC